jgi:hypothetical protein
MRGEGGKTLPLSSMDSRDKYYDFFRYSVLFVNEG